MIPFLIFTQESNFYRPLPSSKCDLVLHVTFQFTSSNWLAWIWSIDHRAVGTASIWLCGLDTLRLRNGKT